MVPEICKTTKGCGTVSIDSVPIVKISSVGGISPEPYIYRKKYFIIESRHLKHIQSHLDIPGFPWISMGEKYNAIFHMIHALHGRLFLHKVNCIYTKNLYKLNQTSMSCVIHAV